MEERKDECFGSFRWISPGRDLSQGNYFWILVCRRLTTYIVQAFLHIFIGPQVAYGIRGSRATRKGNAAAHDISKVSPNAIAYVATIVCLSMPTLYILTSLQDSLRALGPGNPNCGREAEGPMAI